MATARLVASTYSVGSNITVTSIDNAYNNVDNSSSTARFQTTSNSTSDRLCYLRGFNFNSIPSTAVVSAFTVKIKGYESGINTSTSYAPCLVNNTTVLSGTTASENFGTGTKTITIPTGNLTWSTIKGYGLNFGIRFNARRNSRNSASNIYIYGAEINVTYTAETVHVTGVSLNKSSTSIEEGGTETLTETVSPNNATDKSVSWSSSNTAVATVDANGVVTAVSAGTATITVTTTDGGFTDTCAVTVTAPVYKQYTLATKLEAGKSYLIVNGNSGSVYLLSKISAGTGALEGVAATVSNNTISIRQSVESNCLFDCVLQDNGNPNSTILMTGSDYLYTDSSNRLRIASYTSSMDGKHWHYKADGKNLLWFFKDTSGNDGYTDTSSTYKYYLTVSNGNYQDAYVSTTSLENTNTPAVYLFTEAQPASNALYVKMNGAWVSVEKAYKKINGAWVESDLATTFQSGVYYIKGN